MKKHIENKIDPHFDLLVVIPPIKSFSRMVSLHNFQVPCVQFSISLPYRYRSPGPEEFTRILAPNGSKWTHGPLKNGSIQYQPLHYQLASGYD